MEKTIKDHLVDVFDDLESENLKKFKSKLCDTKEEPRVRRAAVERAQYTMELADLIVNTYTEQRAVEVTTKVLTAINCNQNAEDLQQATRGK